MGAGIVVETKSPSFEVGDRVFVTGPGFGVIADGTWRELSLHPRGPDAIPRISTMITLLPSSPVWGISC